MTGAHHKSEGLYVPCKDRSEYLFGPERMNDDAGADNEQQIVKWKTYALTIQLKLLNSKLINCVSNLLT